MGSITCHCELNNPCFWKVASGQGILTTAKEVESETGIGANPGNIVREKGMDGWKVMRSPKMLLMRKVINDSPSAAIFWETWGIVPWGIVSLSLHIRFLPGKLNTLHTMSATTHRSNELHHQEKALYLERGDHEKMWRILQHTWQKSNARRRWTM